MGFLGNGTIGHCTGLETGHNGIHAFHLIQRNAFLRIFEIQKCSQLSMIIFTIYQRSVLFKQLIIAFSCGLL